MPAKRKSPKQNAEALRDGQGLQTSARRHFCTHLMFWTACGRAKCLRARACVGDANECFPRLWPIVPDELKIAIRAAIKAKHAGLPPAEVKAEVKRELVRWRKSMAPRTEQQEMAEPAPQAQSIAPVASSHRAPKSGAPNPRVRSPRLRVL